MKAIRLTSLLFFLFSLVCLGNLFAQTCPASGPVTVINTADSGFGSLRWAINCVNSNAAVNEINFNINSGFSFVEIQLSTALPVITSSNITIDGANMGTPSSNIILFGGYTPSGNGLSHSGVNSNFKNIELIEFAGHGINAASSQNAVFENINSHDNSADGIFVTGASTSVSVTNCETNNNFGDGFESLQSDNITFDNLTSSFNGSYGIYLRQSDNVTILSGEASDNTRDGVNASIGGASPISISNFTASNNTISGVVLSGRTQATFTNVTLDNNTLNGISCALQLATNPATYTNVTTTNNGNYGVNCGTGDHTFANLISTTNGQGVEANCDELSIDGGDISNNTGDGIDLNVDNDTEIKNLPIASNGMNGIDMSNPAGATVLIDNCTLDNNSSRQIWARTSDNVTIQNSTITNSPTVGVAAIEIRGTNYLITGNNVGNATGGNSGIGIEIGSAGTTGIISNNMIGYNATNGVKELSNGTILISQNDFICNGDIGIAREPAAPNVPVITSATTALVEGTAPPNTLVEIFLYDPSCTTAVMGYYQIGVMANAAGDWSVATSFNIGDLVTATATANSDNTSEFAAFATVVAAATCPSTNPVIVTNTNDSGIGSLRWALGCANADPVVDEIEFNIPGTPTILPTTTEGASGAAYEISDFGINIKGSSQPGVKIDGTNMISDDGILIKNANNILIEELVIENFGGSGITTSQTPNFITLDQVDLLNNGAHGFYNIADGVVISSCNANMNGDVGFYSELLEDLEINSSNAEQNGGEGIFVKDVTGTVTISDVHTTSNSKDGVLIDDARTVILDGVTSRSNGVGGINASNITISLTGVVITESNSTSHGLKILNCNGVNFDFVDSNSNDLSGVNVENCPSATFTTLVGAQNNSLNGFEALNSSGLQLNNVNFKNNNFGVYLDNCSNAFIGGGTIQDNTEGIRIENANATITNTTLNSNISYGINLFAADNSIIDNCQLNGNTTLPGPIGIYLDNSDNCQVINSDVNSYGIGIDCLESESFTIKDNAIGVAVMNVTYGINIHDINNKPNGSGLNAKPGAQVPGGVIESNIITNSNTGIRVADNTALVEITNNEIYCNATAGIDRTNNLPPNTTISSASTSTVTGTTTLTSGYIEVFIDDDAGCTGAPEQGKTLVGTAPISGSPWAVPVTGVLAGENLVATVTENSNNTSQFSIGMLATPTCPLTGPVIVTDAGSGTLNQTLRWAIDCVNADPTLDDIHFDLPAPAAGDSLKIFPSTQLPFILDDDVFIDGSTQPTGDRVYIDGSMAGSAIVGLLIQADNVELNHLGLINWGRDGINNQGPSIINDVEFLYNGNNSGTIAGTGLRNPPGGQNSVIDGCLFDGNSFGIRTPTSNVTVRNTTVRNSSEDGIFFNSAGNSILENVTVVNNVKAGIHFDVGSNCTLDSITAHSNNSAGLLINNISGSTIRNLDIHNNGGNGIWLVNGGANTLENGDFYSNSGNGIRVENSINSTVDNINAYSNTNDGVLIFSSQNNDVTNSDLNSNTKNGIGVVNSTGFTFENNNIGVAGANTMDGIDVEDLAFKPGSGTNNQSASRGGQVSSGTIQNNNIQDNLIYGVHASSSVITAPSLYIVNNNMQCNAMGGIVNATGTVPTISSANTSTVTGTGTNGSTIHLYSHNTTCANGAPCQGLTPLGTTTVSGGVWSIAATVTAGAQVTATQTIINNTSAFSTCATVAMACPTGTTVTVINNNDAGDGSLRWAIECANADPVLDNVDFNLVGVPLIIQPNTTMGTSTGAYEITDDGVIINGSSQPGITINGINLPMNDGFVLRDPNNTTFKDIAIENFGLSGIVTIQSPNFVFLDGVELRSNGLHGFNCNADIVEVKNSLATLNGGAGFYANGYLEEFTVKNSDATFNTGEGILLDDVGEFVFLTNVNANNNTSHGISMIDCEDVTMTNVTANDNQGTGIIALNGVGFLNGTTINTNRNLQDYGISLNNCVAVNLSTLTVDDHPINGIHVVDCPSAIFNTGTITKSLFNGIFLTNSPSSLLNNINANNNTEYGVRLENCNGSIVENSNLSVNMGGVYNLDGLGDIIRNSTFLGNCFHAVSIENGADLEVRDCDMNSNAGDGVYCFNTTNVLIENNTIGVTTGNVGNGVTLFAAPSRGVTGTNVKSNVLFGGGTIQNNTIQNNFNYGVSVGQSGSTFPLAYVVNNNMQCNAMGGILNPPLTPPGITLANPSTVTGTGTNGTTVHVYTHNPSCANGAPCQGLTLLGNSTVAGGTWSVPVTGIAAGSQVTATQTFGVNNTSPFSNCALVMLMCDADTSSTNVTCFGLDDGTATSTGNSSPPYTYTWSTAPTNPIGPQPGPSTITGLAPGTYFVTVEDAFECIDIDTFVITEPFPLSYFTEQTNETCAGANDGTALVDDYGNGYTYVWSTGATTSMVSGLAPGITSVTITNPITMCMDTVEFNIIPAPVLILSTNSTNETCVGLNDGTATVNINPAVISDPSLTILWSTGSSATMISGLAPGAYIVTVVYTDPISGSTCSETETIVINAGIPLNYYSVITDETCNNGNDGTAFIDDLGAGYTYLWSTGSTANPITNLAPGNYSVTITEGAPNFCADTLDFTINPGFNLIANLDSTNVTCNGFNNGTATVTLDPNVLASTSGTTTIEWYALPAGTIVSTTNPVSNLAPGQYEVVVTFIDGGATCFETMIFSISEPDPLVSNLSFTHENCIGLNDGTASVSPTGGTSPYTYSWSSGGSTSMVSNLGPGTYTVTITDANMCALIETFTINPGYTPIDTVIGTNLLCFEDMTGSTQVILNPPPVGAQPATYSWSNGSNINPNTNLAAGTYGVTVSTIVSNGNECIGTGSVTITQPNLLETTIDANDVSCFGGSDGFATAVVTGGTMPYTYSWSNMATTPTITGLAPGIYSVTVTDENNCSSIGSVEIFEPLEYTTGISGTNLLCNGDNSGTAEVLVTGSPLFYIYSWSNGANTRSISGLSAGTYTVTVTDPDFICEETETITITEPPLLEASPSASASVTCFGFSDGFLETNPSGGTPPYTYSWTPGGYTTANVTGVPPGSYTVIVTDANMCQSVPATVFIAEPLEFTLDLYSTDLTCFENASGSITANPINGVPTINYAWSNGDTGATTSGLAIGTYTVTATDANGCIAEGTSSVNQPTMVTGTTSSTITTCNGDDDGTATAVGAGGTPGYTYAWSNGDTGSTIDDLDAGTYFVSITDQNGCEIIEEVEVLEPNEIYITFDSTNVTCAGLDDGTATAMATGGAGGPYDFIWEDGTFGPFIDNLSPGFHEVEAIDVNGCFGLWDVEILEPNPIILTASATNVTAAGVNDGTATASGAGDFPPFTYLWSTGDTSPSISGLAPGGYTVTCTDANGCFVEETVFVGGINCNLVIDGIDVTNVICNGGTNGELTVNHSGGTAPHTYIWNNGGTTPTITGLTAGSYSVTVVDVQNCVDSMMAVITEPTAIMSNLTSMNVSGLGNNDGSASLAPTGGTPTYTYLWSTGATTSSITGLAPGTYTATITDSNLCEEIVTVNISEFNCNFNAGVLTPMDATCFGSSTGNVSTNVTTGNPPYTYLWSTGATTGNISNIPAGNYSVTIIDATNCADTLNTTVNEPTQIVLVNSSTNEMSNGANDGTASVVASGGTPTYTYLWSNGATTPMISGLAPGDYTVTCTDANGCERESIVMTVEPYVCSFVVTGTNPTNVLCNGDANGSASVETTGSNGSLTYLWSDGSSAPILTGVMAGSYTVSITDEFNCMVEATVEITEPTMLSGTTSSTGLTTNNGNDGTATANPTGGTPGYTYVWSNGDTNQTATGLTEGTYTVTCTDDNNCTVILDVEIPTFDCVLEIENITPTDVMCFGDMDGMAAATVINSVGTVNYTWSTGATGNPVSNLSAGNYGVTVSDDTNCTDEITVTISEPAAITSNLTTSNQTIAGVNDGSASVSPIGGTAPYNVTWSNGDTGNNTAGLAPGNYSVSIIDANDCELIEPFTIQDVNCDLAIQSLTSTPVTCFGDADGTATPIVVGGDGNYTFSWSNGSTDSLLTNGMAGLQILSVSDNSGCFAGDTITIAGPPELFSNLTSNDESASGAMDGTAMVAPTGGTPGYTILWSTGETSNSISGLSPNSFSVEVSDLNNCTVTESFTISAFNCDLVLNNIINSDVSCFGLTDGTATPFVTGGDGNYTFTWDNGSQDSVLTAGVGTYNLVVTDGANCSASGMITISEPTELVSNFTFTNETAMGMMDGTAMVDPMGGTPNYTVLWSTGETSNSVSGLAPGSYDVIITDMNDCEVIVPFSIQGFGCNLVADSISTTDVTCFGLTDGIATSFISGEVDPVTYLWSNGETTATINNLAAGTYFLTITDARNCTALDTAIILQPDELSITLTGTNASVSGTSDGAVTSMVEGGVMPYTYSWNNGETTEDLIGIAAGMYTLEITDANNCTASESIEITNDGSPCDLEISLMQIRSVRCFGESNGSLTPVTLGGEGPMTFLWSDGSTDSIAANLPTGEFDVLITDQNGCTARDTAIVPEPDTLVVSITSTDQTVIGTNDGTATASATGGNIPYEWLWDNGEITNAITDLAPGLYSVTATDRNGCEATGSVRIRDANDPVCETFAGTMARDTLKACAGDTILANQMDPAILDSDDLVEYVLHDSPSDLLGNVLSRNDIPEFSIVTGMETGRPYYISAIAGDDDGFGSVDLADSCLSVAIGQVAIFINSPAGVYTMQGPNLACGNVPFFLEAGVLAGSNDDVQFRWILPTGDVIFTDDPSVAIIPSSNLFTGDYYVSRDSLGCSSPISSPIFIEVVSLAPDVIDAGRDTILCDGTSFNIEATSTLNEPGSWSSVGIATVVSPNSLSTEVRRLQPGANEFVWKVALDDCPSANADTVRVIVERPPQAVEDRFQLINATDVISVNVLQNDNLVGVVDTVITLLTQPQFGNIEYDPMNKEFKYWLNEAERGVVEFTYEVCNPTAQCGIECDTATVLINSFALPELPGGMTPDGDGNNDVLIIKGLKGFDQVKVKVVNRWGSLVYSNDNYDNDNPWDGTYDNDGNPLPGGTYYYFVDPIDDGEVIGIGRNKTITGALHIINR